MRVRLDNLGVIKQADLTLGDLTIICGENNTGKTYVTYALYGFLDYWHKELTIDIPNDIVTHVMEKGSIAVPLADFAKDAEKILNTASVQFSKNIDKVFAAKASFFDHSSISVKVEQVADHKTNNVRFSAGSAERSLLEVTSDVDDDNLTISLLVDKNVEDLPPRAFIVRMISAAIKRLVFKDKIPRPFIASAERTGCAIFQKELDFTRSRLIDLIGDKASNLSPMSLLGSFKSEYPIPVKKNVDFIRELSNISNEDSLFVKQHPDVLAAFSDIIGGDYKVSKDGEIQYTPANKRSIKLTMVESSSAVRSLLDIGFYLRHVAKEGDLLVVDEPELNLHPKNQRKLARLFAMLVNHGIKVFITTHSDYIIKELNTLILLNKPDERLQSLASREGYSQSELLSSDQLSVYIAKESLVLLDGKSRKSRCHTLVEAPVDDEVGIALASFDDSIEDMNRIQEEIVWGE